MYRSIPLLLLSLAMTSTVDEPMIIDRVEEDWELVILNTDVPAAGPQITTTMCPGPIADHPVINFNLNYRLGGAFQPGGLQVEVYDGQSVIATTTSKSESLQTENETITWTQKLSISGGTATYRVMSGQSTTWGSFGGDDLTVTFATALGDMSSYSSDNSVQKSGIGWQSDHVTSMRLMAVRCYSGDTLVSTDSATKTVHPAAVP